MKTKTKLDNVSNFFTQDNPRKVWAFADNCPEWLREAVYGVHCGKLPDDWVFEQCVNALYEIENGNLTEDTLGEYADGRVDVYTSDLAEWFKNFCNSEIFADAQETYKDCNGGELSEIEAQLRGIQYFAIEAIAKSMLVAAQENCE